MNQSRINALREKWAAEVTMLSEDYIGARKKLLKAQQIYPALDNIDAMLTVCNILLLTASIKLSDSKIDDYRVLDLITPSVTYSGAGCHYQKLVTLLQPIRDEFPGTEFALQVVQKALSKLSDGDKHLECDVKQGTSCGGQITTCNSISSGQTSGGGNKEGVSAQVLSERSRNLEPNLLAYHDGTDEQDDIISLQETSSEGDIYWSPITVTPKKPDQEFYNFENNRKAEIFKTGQIWAAHYQANVPLNYRYGRINNNDNYTLSVTWLKPVGTSPSERSWCVAGLPVGCGLFDLNPETNDEARPMAFSHKCSWFHAVKEDQFNIYPQKGEIWALYKNWNIEEWAYNPEKVKGCKFELVELLSEFSRCSGADVACLVKVDGFRSVFQRQTNGGNPVIYQIPANNLYIFSHNVLEYRLMDGIFELDQLALPDNVVTHDINTLMVLEEENRASSSSFTPTDQMPSLESYAESKFSKSILSPHDFVFGQVWAVYCGKDAMPRRYIHINDVISEGQVCATFLEPQPILDAEIEWKKEMLPVACGMFELSKTNDTVEMSQVSHIVKYQQYTTKPHYMIYPMKGEIWAMYKNWNHKWKQTDYGSCHQCWVVEIISEFSKENGVNICRLGEVKNCLTFFHRQKYDGFDMARTVTQAEMLSFSHRIPAYKVPGTGKYGIPEGAWHLEPNALPLKM